MISPNTSGTKHLLLVDDDRLVLSTVKRNLATVGYQVSAAESAEDAETLLTGGLRPDLALLDIRMPGMGGLYLARRLRELDRIPFVMFSAYSEQSMVEEATRHGALAYLVKPLDIPQLVPAIEAAMARANEIQELTDIRLQLQEALDAERTINVAVGITMMQHRCTRHEAFDMLRKAARTQRCKLVQLADEIIDAGASLAL